MGKLILYGLNASPPVRATLMCLKALQLPFEYKIIDLLKGEHLKSDFLHKNPQHCVPTLEDDNHILVDSHAIMAYLVNKYAKNDELYSKDLYKRALIDQRLYFEAGVMFERGLRNITMPLIFKNVTTITKDAIETIKEIYNMLETFLNDSTYMAGSNLTIADFSIIATTTSLKIFQTIDPNKYSKLSAWMKRMESLSYYQETNGIGTEQLHALLKSKNLQINDSI